MMQPVTPVGEMAQEVAARRQAACPLPQALERRGTHHVTSVEDGRIGPAPLPDFTRPVDFGTWAADFIKWGRQKGQPLRIRIPTGILQLVTGAKP